MQWQIVCIIYAVGSPWHAVGDWAGQGHHKQGHFYSEISAWKETEVMKLETGDD